MYYDPLSEPEKWRCAVYAALYLGIFFALLLIPFTTWRSQPQTPVFEVSLVPAQAVRPEPAQPLQTQQPEKQPEKQIEKPALPAADKPRPQITRTPPPKITVTAQLSPTTVAMTTKVTPQTVSVDKSEELMRGKEALATLRAQKPSKASQAARNALVQRRLSRLIGDLRQRIRERINNYLTTPQSVDRNEQIEVVVRVRLNADGSLREVPVIVASSGNKAYDESAIKAVLRAVPLPMPKDPFIVNDPALMQQFMEHRLHITPQ